ncbi:hypothetical protein CTAYLR_005756 [Chrysophaeum taylorii]|uniref:Uncharacterized protein n=1 Tax=Chrysophaeum taylorii TaxID=2483200 RepID=A0AAD7UK69_9STRA|nr:hypothetical protein CTAYLR_005756 [Chrysophaeum taylorii]
MHGRSRHIGISDVSAFERCAKSLGGPVFLSTDSKSLRDSDFGDRKPPWDPSPFATYQTNPSKGGTSLPRRPFDANSLKRTFAEWFALSRCEVLVASKSGFSRTAAAVAKVMANATVRYVTHPTRGNCLSDVDRLLLQGGAGL